MTLMADRLTITDPAGCTVHLSPVGLSGLQTAEHVGRARGRDACPDNLLRPRRYADLQYAAGVSARFDDALDTLQLLRERGYRIGVLSNQAAGTTRRAGADRSRPRSTR